MAHAAMISLRFTLKNHDIVKNYNTRSEWDDEIDSICETLGRLDDECYRGIDRSDIHELEAKIRDAAWKLEDVVDSHRLSQGTDDTAGVKQKIHSFFETAKKLGEEYERALQNSSCVAEEDIIDDDHDNSTTVGIGVSDLSEQIISGLLDAKSEYKIFPIWGMAGIGKTHLARSIYHHPLIVQHFDLRLWVRIGPIHKDLKNIFVDILSQIERKPRDIFKEKDEDELRLLVCSLLDDRKYLIAFDDMWSKSVLNDFLRALSFASNDKCKALITTRIFGLAETFYGNQEAQMPFLSDEESWNLLRLKVFAEKPFPTQLERAGRKIAEICEGLPLLILTVADILRGLDETEDCWNKVAQKKTTTFPDAYDRIYKVLISSYDYLPQKYKASFLYMGVFRQSHQIPFTKLLFMLLIEGLLEDSDVLQVLFCNSVIILSKYGFSIKFCKLHSVYWYVCVTEARKTKLFHVLIKLRDVSIERPRRLSVQNNMLLGLKEVYDSIVATTSSTRSLLFTGKYHQYPVQICFNAMILIKVLEALGIRFYEFPNEITNLLLLRYLALTHNGEVPSSISILQRLHYLILRRHHNIINMLQRDSRTCLPKEIWEFEKLVYLRIMGSNLPNPSHGVELPHLENLYVNADSCTEGVFRGTPKLVKLGIRIELQPEDEAESLRCLEHIWILERLKKLKCVVVNPRLSSQVVAPPNHLSNLPRNLKTLSLSGLGYPWKYISAIASLPNLKILKLRCSAFQGAVWEIKDGEFLRLQNLLLEDIDVVTVDVRGLENPNHLIFRHCYKLKTILLKNIISMKMIEVDECSPSIVELAQEMKDNPNHPHPKVAIKYSWNL